jgi:hypothetical protein
LSVVRIFRGLVAGALVWAGASVFVHVTPAAADIVGCVSIAVTIPNTPVELRQHPCVPIGLDSVPPNTAGLLGPSVPVAEEQEASAEICVELAGQVQGVPTGLDEARCQSVPLVTPPAGVVPPLPQVPFPPPIPPPIPGSIPPHIPGLPPLPIPTIPIPALPLPV